MNREEINEALKIIKEPITVNSIEYKYFDQENYEKLLRVYENCRWFIDNYEQVLQNIEKSQQELQRKDNIINAIKEELKQKQEYYRYRKDNRYRTFLSNILDKIKELEGGDDDAKRD